MALPATGTTISINQVQIYYGFTSGTTRTMSALGTQVGITVGGTVNLSASFGGH
jgi:hypothetical protein|tara:strand:- start:1549 stop:1710 length:162 start_codon:yes stop_codon:yes gene_type:complete